MFFAWFEREIDSFIFFQRIFRDFCYRHRPLGNTSLQDRPRFSPKVLLDHGTGDWGEPREDYHRRFSVNQGLPELQNSEWHLGLFGWGWSAAPREGMGSGMGWQDFGDCPLGCPRFFNGGGNKICIISGVLNLYLYLITGHACWKREMESDPRKFSCLGFSVFLYALRCHYLMVFVDVHFGFRFWNRNLPIVEEGRKICNWKKQHLRHSSLLFGHEFGFG